ncbi:GNAT family acetyltransferase [Dictyobacter sp. S3.2.2.5]|uniref:GNAT family acetyltransferase n=1 Tax=Dictyobacter halimunensis TaxID=3026934 RepID=A0ABQ6G579_9CHLR|nr:GNAT family acetyltransferase [Dictyobacter sp. S3.2.2.5]
MSDILQHIDSARMPAIIDDSLAAYRSWLCTACGGQLYHERDVWWADSGLVRAAFHMQPPLDVLSQSVEHVRDYFAQRNRGFQWFLAPSEHYQGYADALLAHGLEHDEEEPGMAIELQDLNEDVPPVPGLSILPVQSLAQLELWVRVWLFPLHEAVIRQVIGAYARVPFGPDSPNQFYLGLIDGKPVATVCNFYDGCVAAIHYVVTLPEHRRQGIGTAMTLLAAREARARGYRVAVLTASPSGHPVYRRLGFREYGAFNTYVWHPGDSGQA